MMDDMGKIFEQFTPEQLKELQEALVPEVESCPVQSTIPFGGCLKVEFVEHDPVYVYFHIGCEDNLVEMYEKVFEDIGHEHSVGITPTAVTRVDFDVF